ncbi:uncharacterized protein E0L32_001331 [Thyridium curvatum]|uniref:Uncharacterized protein n=1 Tax=Thyridium curvatum TaxID=1093900 RepID=A0A507AUG5_9PEZI|nr:uncharacterized protein E0L32_001331 [Thyridium curvatum]TPX10134.1 hypothetical protein E0L32_001331 [Thyridium curvatum]
MSAWLRSPFLGRPARPDSSAPDSDDAAAVAAPAAGETAALQIGPLAPSDSFTAHQLFYVFGIDGVGAMILSGGINFGIACGRDAMGLTRAVCDNPPRTTAMYANQDVERNPIRLFQLPNTLAGDGAVTIVVQCLVTWVIELVLVTRDLRAGGVQPVGFVPAPENPGWLLRALLALPEDTDTDPDAAAATTTTPATTDTVEAAAGTAHQPTLGGDKFWSARRWAALLAAQVLAAVVPSFFLLWAPAVGILTAVGRRRFDAGWGWDWYFGRRWAPEVFKLLFGGLLALLTTPPVVLFWLVRCGWEVRAKEQVVVVDGDGDGDGGRSGSGSGSGSGAAVGGGGTAEEAGGDVGGETQS